MLKVEPTSLNQEERGADVAVAVGEAYLDNFTFPEMSVTSADKKDTGQETAPSSERRGRQELSLPTEVRKVRRRQTGRRRSIYPPRSREKGSESNTHKHKGRDACFEKRWFRESCVKDNLTLSCMLMNEHRCAVSIILLKPENKSFSQFLHRCSEDALLFGRFRITLKIKMMNGKTWDCCIF